MDIDGEQGWCHDKLEPRFYCESAAFMKYLWEIIISFSINSIVLNEEGYHTENIKHAM